MTDTTTDADAPPRQAARRRRHRLGPVGRATRWLFWTAVGLGVRLAVAVMLAVGAATYFMYEALPHPDDLLDGRARGSVTLLDARGVPFAWRGDQFGGEVGVGDVSPHLVHAIIAIEDRRFRRHWGVDPRGVARAFVANIRAGRLVEGGSTITQQVAKNVFLSSERSIERKLKEVPMALAMEFKYTKDEILSVYLNRVYLGAGAYGFEAAAQRYFGKSARFLDVAEAAMLAGLLKAPSRFSPASDIERARARASLVLRAMAQEGFISATDVAVAQARPARLSTEAAARVGGQFADWAMASGPTWLTEATREDVVMRTTFDRRAQAAAEAALAQVFAERVRPGSHAEAAIAVLSPNGAVRALVGGRDGGEGAFNRATQARRQTGSTFKPVIFAKAMEQGLSPLDTVLDAPVTVQGWSPSNVSDRSLGAIPLRQALAQSVNTATVRLYERVGREPVRALAGRLGLAMPADPVASTALGSAEATLLEMTGVYAAFASGGLDGRPWAIRDLRLRGEDAGLMRGDGPRRRVMDARVAGLTTHMLAEVVRSGTGRRAAPADGRPVAGKTGTTQAARDAWFIGFSADYVVGVWMGYDDNTPLTGVTGGGLPAVIWRETMARLHAGMPHRPLPEVVPAPPRPPATTAGRPDRERPPAPVQGPALEDTMLGRLVADVARRLRGGD